MIGTFLSKFVYVLSSTIERAMRMIKISYVLSFGLSERENGD